MLHFQVIPVRLEFVARDYLYLPPGKESNIFRGALGSALRKISEAEYTRIFDPRWNTGPSGYADAPRPFVLRSPSRDGEIAPGQSFACDLFLFDTLPSTRSILCDAFTLAAATGLGPTKAKAELTSFETREPARKFPLFGAPGSGTLRLRFATPTQLKGSGGVLAEPQFPVLIHRLAERIRALGRLYQNWPADWDGAEPLNIAESVNLTRWEWTRTDVFRRSARNGQQHSIGGFTGWAEYTGPLAAFLPLLEIGRWTGVGRQTVWGNGEIRIEATAPSTPSEGA